MDQSVHVEGELYYLKLHRESSNESSGEDGNSFRFEMSEGREAIRKPCSPKSKGYSCSQTAENI